MARRSTPQKTLDEQAFPVRIKLVVGGSGLAELAAIQNWLNREVGCVDSAVHSASGIATDAVAIYLRDIEAATRLGQAFPDLVLADGTQAATYSNPHHHAAWTSGDLLGVCNLYSITKGQAAIIAIARAMISAVGNLPPLPAVFPDQFSPVVRNTAAGRELAMLRWGMPSPPFALRNRSTDSGVTNIRNTTSPHWRPWLGVEHRCVVPFTSFCEYDTRPGQERTPVWFALSEDRPLGFFAGIWTRWTSVRKLKEGETTNDLFGFLTTDANAVVAPIHPKAMPVILTEPEEIEHWLTAPFAEACRLQRPLSDDRLRIVARGAREDGGGDP